MTKKLFILLLSMFCMYGIYAQGCSDAGFCSLNYRDVKKTGTLRNSFGLEAAYHAGESSTTVFVFAPEFSHRFGQSLTLHNKLTFSNMHGAFGNAFNIGDLYSTITFVPGKQKDQTFSFLAGIKIPFTRSNDKINKVSLPMVYQSSLGTLDLLAGGSVMVSGWELQGAVQLPVFNWNRNSFLSAYSPLPGYLNTNLFERRPDVLLRLNHPFTIKSWSLNPGILGIYHLGEDTYEDIYGKRTMLNGSEGLTLNLNLNATLNLRGNRSLKFSAATPLLVRESRPDGLTRSFVASVAYMFQW